MTPLTEAAHHLNDIKDSQRHALDLALALVDRLPFAPQDINVAQLRRSFRFQWGVQVHVLRANAALFPALAAELNATQQTDVHSIGRGEVARYEVLTGELAGVPFEIRAYIGSQKVQAAA